MLQISINEKGGEPRHETFEKGEITIGRVQGNDVILPKGNISKRHSRIVLKDGKFVIVDLKSTNGTYVNGKKITAPQVIKATDKIYIGDFTLQLTGANGSTAASVEPAESVAAPVPEEIDLFGGDALEAEPPKLGRPGGSAPGLIDDNFDQEFEAEAQDSPVTPSPPMDFELKNPPSLSMPAPSSSPQHSPTEQPELEQVSFESTEEPEVPSLAKKPPAMSRTGAARARPVPSRRSTAVPKSGLSDIEIHAPRDASLAAAGVGLRPDAEGGIAHAARVVSEPLDRRQAVLSIHQIIAQELGLRGLTLEALASVRSEAIAIAEREVGRLRASGRLIAASDVTGLAELAAAAALDMEPILDLLLDEAVVEISITGDGRVWADREGHLEPTGRVIDREADVIGLIRRLAVLGGADPSAIDSLLDVRLLDGARVVAALPPVAFRGPTLSYRKTTRDAFSLEKLLEYSTISTEMMTFLDYCLRYRKGILLSVGPGVGATATLNALTVQMPDDDRIVTIENGVELHLGSLRNVTALEPKGNSDMGALVRHAAAMQAERVVLGGLGGPAAAEVVRAFSGPLEGSVASYPANNPSEAVSRLANIELASSYPDSAAAMRLLAMAFPVVLQETRFHDNSRRMTVVSELSLTESGEVVLDDIFDFLPEGVDEQGIVTGTFRATGHQPRFLEELVDRGEAVDVDMEIFKE